MTSLNIVAHEDDCLLFLNPDIAEDNRAVIVYMTMGDDGNGQDYVEMRKNAAKQAWSGFPNVSLKFLPLHSNCFRTGDLQGWLHDAWQELQRVQFMENQSSWNPDYLLRLLQWFMYDIQPDIIRTHDPDTEPAIDHDEPHLDHIDHIYTAKFVQEAVKAFPQIPIYAYEGYPIRYKESNVSPEGTALKTKMWRAYQAVDTSVAGEIWDVAMSRMYKRRIQ